MRAPLSTQQILCCAIVGIWPVAWGLALFGFHVTWRTWPDYGDMVLATTLYAPFALPISFGGLWGKALGGSDSLALVLGIAYWPLICTGLWRTIRHESWIWLGILAVVVWSSSYLWLIISVGMMGI